MAQHAASPRSTLSASSPWSPPPRRPSRRSSGSATATSGVGRTRRGSIPWTRCSRPWGGTYYGEGANACHLDLVQWATDPTWGGIGRQTRRRLLDDDLPFLLDQVRASRLRLILVNGNGVLRVLGREAGCRLRQVGDRLECGSVVSRIMEGELEGVRLLGWSANLQSSHGVSLEFRGQLAARIAELASA